MAAVTWITNVGAPYEIDFWPMEKQVVNAADSFDGSTEIVPLWFKWRAMLRWQTMPHDEAHRLAGFLNGLRGRANHVKVPHTGYRRLIGDIAGTLTFASNHAAGLRTITYNGATGGGFSIGDYVEIAQTTDVPRLHQIVGISGTTLTINPPLRGAKTSGNGITKISGATAVLHCTMELASEIGPSFWTPDGGAGLVGARAVEFVESLRSDP